MMAGPAVAPYLRCRRGRALAGCGRVLGIRILRAGFPDQAAGVRPVVPIVPIP